MQGSIAQILGLAMHGNAYLQGKDIGTFWPEATFFRFCRAVRFLAADGGVSNSRETVIAADPDAWLRWLGSGREGLRVHVVPRNDPGIDDMITVGFAGGGSHWLIEEVGGSRPLIWSDEWSAADPESDDERIWSIVYRGVPAKSAVPPLSATGLDRAERELGESLRAIAGFAERIGSGYGGIFRRALSCLGREQACAAPYYPDIAPAGLLSPRAHRILTACQIGWVFGGMGSWNDGSYDGPDVPEGDRVSEALFDALQTALAEVANSTFPSPGGRLSL